MNYFYDNLKFIRERKKLSMEKFGELINQSSANVSRWENKNNGITVDVALDVAQRLGYPLGELIEKDLRVEENVILDENHKLDIMIQDKSKDLTEDGKKALINIIDNLSSIDNK
jgi:transcriptional regulator with XRE-family HTH domain